MIERLRQQWCGFIRQHVNRRAGFRLEGEYGIAIYTCLDCGIEWEEL